MILRIALDDNNVKLQSSARQKQSCFFRACSSNQYVTATRLSQLTYALLVIPNVALQLGSHTVDH